jgi:hypothetical protein
MAATAAFRGLICTGFTGTLVTSATRSVYGDLILSTGMTLTQTSGAWVFLGTVPQTFTSNGKTVNIVQIGNNSVAVDVTLGSALNLNSSFSVQRGTFNTGNFNFTGPSFSASNPLSAKTLNFGSSTVTITNNVTGFNLGFTNTTFNAGTSTVVFSSSVPVINTGSGATFYDISFTDPLFDNVTISGANTYRNFTISARQNQGVSYFYLGANQTITGTFTYLGGFNAATRVFVLSDISGTTRTINCAAANLTNVDFRDIAVTGSVAPLTGTRLGDAGGNSGVVFDAPKTVYRSSNSSSWGVNAWAFTSGGASTFNAYPLPQDTAVFDDTFPSSGTTVSFFATLNVGTIDMSTRTVPMTLGTGTIGSFGAPVNVYGNWLNGSGTTLTGTGVLRFWGRGSQTVTSAGKTFSQALTIDCLTGSVNFLDAFATTNTVQAALNLISGTFGTAFNVTSPVFSFTSTSIKTVNLGAGTWTLTGSGNAWNGTSTNTTLTGSGSISLTSASAKTFVGANILTYPALNQGGTGTLTVSGANKFTNLTNTAIGRIQFTLGTTNQFDNFNISGVAGNLLQLGSTGFSQATLRKVTPWLMGANSTDAGSNTGLAFIGGGGVDYLSVSFINGTLTSISATVSELATATDTIGRVGSMAVSLTETATGADDITGGLLFAVATAETTTASDIIDAAKLYVVSVIEATSSQDVITAGLAVTAALTELATSADTLSASVDFVGDVSESATGVDDVSGVRLLVTGVLELATAQALVDAIVTFNRSVVEAASAQDDASTPASIFNAAVANSSQAQDALSPAGSIYNVSTPVSAVATDVLVGALLWNPIDDSQNPNWGAIPNPQAPSWAGVGDNQNPNWQNGSTS